MDLPELKNASRYEFWHLQCWRAGGSQVRSSREILIDESFDICESDSSYKKQIH